MNKTMFSILRVLDKHKGIVGSKEISSQLKNYGVDLAERTVRYHLKILDERGLTEVFGREGRKITEKGRHEVQHSRVSQKLGFMISKIESLSYQTTVNLDTLKGNIILNMSFFPEEQRESVMGVLKPVFSSPYIMSDRIIFTRAGGRVGDVIVPQGKIGFGTVCSITINGIFLKAGIPVTSRFGGVVEIVKGKPERFVSLISYEGSSLDPLEIFIKSGMTNVSGLVNGNSGRVLASFREIPVVCIEAARRLTETMTARGIKGVMLIGEPNKALLEIPVGIDKVGMVVVGGLNPVAAIEECGICTENSAMSALYEYSKLTSF